MLRNIGMLVLLCSAASAQSNDTAAPGQLGAPHAVLSYSLPSGPSGNGYNALLRDNGAFVTGLGNGLGGANTSEIQSVPQYNTFGYGHALSANVRLADDFTVPAGKTWTLGSVKWYAYQTQASGTVPTLTSANVRIWKGAAGPVGAVPILAGDTTTNRLTGSVWTGCYRVTNTTLTNGQRAVHECTIDLSWVPVLSPDTYWIDVQMNGSVASGPWAVPTVPFVSSDNGQQFNGTVANTWTLTQDTIALTPQDFPYKIDGTELGGTTTYCTAKTTSNGCIPAIGSTGTSSASATSGFSVNATQMINNKNCLLFYGVNGQASTPFQGGFLCVNTPIKRTPGTNTGGNVPPNDCSGVPSIDMNTFASGGLGGTPLPALSVNGTVVDCQWWGRDPGFASPNNTQLSNGFEYTVGP